VTSSSRGNPAGQWRVGLVLLGLGIAVGLVPGPLAAQKTDLVVMRNGDRITGQVKEVARGMLDYSTDDVGRLSIEWEKVARVTSVHPFEVEVASGRKYFGWLTPSTEDGVMVVTTSRADTLRIRDVVAIMPLNAGFFQRVKAYLDVGFTLAKANAATTLSVSWEAEYRGPKMGTSLTFDSYAQGQDSSETTTRNSGTAQVQRFLPNRWSFSLLAGAEQNDELGLALRFTGGGVAGRVLSTSNRSEFSGQAGLVFTRERFLLGDPVTASPDTSTDNVEGLLAMTWEAFRFDSPKLDMTTSLVLYPSLSSLGRLRGDFTVRLKYELVRDFFVGVNFSDTFDSRPPDANASKNDYVTSLTIGWSYRR
jgi:hypothetical protein